MPTYRPAGLPRAPAGVAAVLAAAVGAPLLDGQGLLVPGGSPSPGTAAILRVAGIAIAVGATAALVARRGPDWRTVPASLGAAAAVAGTLALLTLPVSPVALDWPPPPDPAPLGPSDPRAGTGAGGGTAAPPPPVLRLPAGGGLDVRGDVLLLELPDGSTFDLGRTDGEGGGALPGPVIQLEVTEGGGVSLTDGAGTDLGALPPGGADLDLGDVRIEDQVGGGVAEVAGGTVTDAGGGASGRLDLVPVAPDRAGQDAAAAVAGALLAAGAYYLVFLHGRLRPGRVAVAPAADASPALPSGAPAEDPAAAGAGLAATLEAMLLDPDPRTAIVAAYARLLDALAAAGYGRHPQEAPHEHLRRVLHPLGARPGPVHDLADLFVLARFGHAPLTDGHRTAAIDALRAAVDDLRVPAAVLVPA